MYAPEDQQVEICLLKSNLEDIENELVLQRSSLPDLDAENDQQYRETMNALRGVRALNAEVERLKQENVQLVAKRMQLKKQCEDTSRAIDNTKETRERIMKQLGYEESHEENYIRKYEESLRAKAERFRKARSFYNEDEMAVEMKNLEIKYEELLTEVEQREHFVSQLRLKFDKLQVDVPEDIVDIAGKRTLSEKLQEVTKQCETLKKTPFCVGIGKLTSK